MAEPGFVHGPSRLRHQVRSDATDNARSTAHDVVQIPDSDFCVEETQYGPANTGDVPDNELSPNSRGILDKCHVSQSSSHVEPVPTPTVFLSRQTVGDKTQAASPFTFQSFKSAPSKPIAKAEPQVPVPGVNEAAMDSCSDTSQRKDAAHNEEVSQNARPVQRRLDGKRTMQSEQTAAHHVDCAEEQIQTESMFASPLGERAIVSETNYPLRDTPVDAQEAEEHPVVELTEAPAPEAKRTKLPGKKGKKPRKGQHSGQANGSLAPSKQRGRPQDIAPPSPSKKDILDVIPTAHSRPTFVAVGDQDTAPVLDGPVSLHQDRQRPGDVSQQPSLILDDQNFVSSARDHELMVQGLPMCAPQDDKASKGRPRRMYNATGAPEAPDSVLYEVASHGQSNRIGKPQKSARTGGKPRGRGGGTQTLMNRSPVDDLLESIRFSFVAEQVKHEHTQEAISKAQHDTLKALKDTNLHYRGQIDALEATEQELRTSLKQKCEVAKKLQKYVQGLSNDHVKFKATVISHENSCKKILGKKILELESEKTSMVNDFQNTISHLESSQKNLRAVANECYSELRIVSARKNDLIKIVNDQHVNLERERQRCASLERQIDDSLRTIHRRLEDDHEALLRKLESVRNSFDLSNVGGCHDALTGECAENLRKLRETPFLTINDVEKAESMLRYVHESIESKLGSLAKLVDSSKMSPEEIQDNLYEQLQKLRSEILKHDEAKADYYKACQSNEHLIHQLDLQREQCKQLDEQVQGLQLSEANLKARSSQLELERDLRAIKDQSRNDENEPAELELEIAALRVQLKKAEEDFHSAAARLENSEHLRLEQEASTVQMRKRAEESEARLAKTSKKSKNEEFERRVLLMRREIEKDSQKKSQEKEATLANNLHRVTRERDENEQSMQATTRELEATNNVLHEVREKLRTAESKIMIVQKDKADFESKLKKSRQSPRKADGTASEIARLKEELELQSAAFKAKEAELSETRQQQTGLHSHVRNLSDILEKTELQLSEQHATIESSRDQSTLRFLEQEQKHKTELQEAKDQAARLQRQIQELDSSLTQERRSSETQIREVQSRHQFDKDDMERQLSDLRTAKAQSESELARVKREAVEQLEVEEAKGRTEFQELQRHLAESNAALKESEAKVKRIQHESQQALATHKDLTAKKYAELGRIQASTAASREHSNRTGRVRSSSQTQAARPTRSSFTPSSPVINQRDTHVAKLLMKVNRQDNSVLSVDRSVHTKSISKDMVVQPANELGDQDDKLSDSVEGVDASTDYLGAMEPVDENSVPLADRASDLVPETHEQSGLTMDFARFNERLSEAAPELRSSTSELSLLDSDLIDPVENQQETTPVRSDRQTDRQPVRSEVILGTAITTPNRPEYAPNSSFQSLDRPGSRANSAARMAPPSGSFSQRDRHSHSRSREVTSPSMKESLISTSLGKDLRKASSPDFAHPHSMTTYGHHARQSLSSVDRAPHTRGTPDARSSTKRKSSGSSAERSSASKRARESSVSLPSSLQYGNHRQKKQASPQSIASNASSQQRLSSGPSVFSLSSKSVRGSVAQDSATGSSSRPNRRSSARINNMQDRFSQELR